MEMINESVAKKNWKMAFLCLAVYGLIAIRLIGFPQIPGGLNQDGAMGAVDARALSEYATDRYGTFMPAHFEAWRYGQMSVLLSYLTVPFIKLFGLTKLAMRLPMLLASLAGASGIYGIVKRLFGEKTGVTVLLFLAVNPWHFMQSRWALDCNLFPHMFVLGLYFLIKGFVKKRDLYLSMIFFGLCMFCYGVAFYMVPFFLLASCILLLLQKKVNLKDVLLCLLIYFGVSWPIYGTMLINFMKWETVRLPFVTMQFFAGNVRTADILLFSDNIGQQFLSNLRSLFDVVFLQKEDWIWNSVKGFGTMYKCSMPFILLGAVSVLIGAVKEKDVNKKAGCQLLLCFWLFSLLVGIMINYVNVNRINIIFYVHIIFAAVGIYFVIRKWRKTLYVILAAYGLLGVMFFHQYFTTWAQDMEKAFYADFVDALAYVKEYDCDCYYITPDTQYEGSSNVSEILTLFVFDVDAKYYQGEAGLEENRNRTYWDKFRYSNPPENLYAVPENTAYVFRSSIQDHFPKEQFCVTVFGDYAAAIPWYMINS
ncbi:MAG: glycosyltransferase family 39 protein [Lachnospiraceae bacterium]|nr:glycosyltransferase family 39 protein [Lachnospiraceae bacterium]